MKLRINLVLWLSFVLVILQGLPLAAQSVNAKNMLKIARSYAEQGDWAQAKDYANRALKDEPGYVDALYMRAFAHRELAEYVKAEADFREVIHLEPTYIPTYGGLAEIFLRQKEYEKAEKVFASLHNQPDGPKWASYYRGVAWYQRADLIKAESSWSEAVKLDVNFGPAHHNLGALFLAQGQSQKALVKFREALDKNPETPVYLFHIAWALDRMKQYPEAQKLLKTVIEDQADDEHYKLLAQGLERLTRQQFPAAVEVLKTCVQKYPEDFDGWLLLGRAYFLLKNFPEAKKALEKAQELDPAFLEAKELLKVLPSVNSVPTTKEVPQP